MRWFILLLLVVSNASAQFNFSDQAFLANGLLANDPCVALPRPVVYLITETNNTAAGTVRRVGSSFAMSSNVLYLAATVNSKASSVDSLTAITNGGAGITWTILGQTNISDTHNLAVSYFCTNVDVATQFYSAGFPGTFTGSGITILAISNVHVGAISGAGLAAILQHRRWGVAVGSATNHLAALDTSGSNIVVVAAALAANTQFAVTENRVEISDLTYNTPSTSFTWEADTNSPVSDNTIAITTSGAWTTHALELRSLYNAPPAIRGDIADTTIVSNLTATLTIYAMGGCNLLYQWTRTNRVDGYTNIPSATTVTYTTPQMTLADSGDTFRCVVTNLYGGATSSVAVVSVVQRINPDIFWNTYSNGSGTTATSIVGPNLTTDGSWVTGQSGSGFALDFNASSQESVSASAINEATNKLTFSGWFWFDDTNATQICYEKGNNYNTSAHSWVMFVNAGRITFGMNGSASNTQKAESTQAPPTGAWIHIGAFLDASTTAGNVSIFYNGIERETTVDTLVHDDTVAFASWTLNGANRNGGTFRLDGKEDDVRVASGNWTNQFNAWIADPR